MTLREALDQRIPRVRDPKWHNPHAYLRLPLMDGFVGPWAELYDDDAQENVLHVRPGSQRIPMLPGMGVDLDGLVEAYTGPVSPFETHKDNFASAYLES